MTKAKTSGDERFATRFADQVVRDKNPIIKFRVFQKPIFFDRESGIAILHWSRQIGKSYTLAAWAVDRLLTQLQKYD